MLKKAILDLTKRKNGVYCHHVFKIENITL